MNILLRRHHCLVICVLLAIATQVRSATLTVSTFKNAGVGSLRAAITRANRTSERDTVVFAPGIRGTLKLLSALPDLTTNITIVGPGRERLTIRRIAKTNFRLLTITRKANVSLRGLTFAGGRVARSPKQEWYAVESGGAISNSGSLVVDDCTFTDNSADGGGGAIYNQGVQMTLSNCHITRNTLTTSQAPRHFIGGGAGLLNFGSDNALVVNCIFADNNAGEASGGAVSNGGTTASPGTLSIINSFLTRNRASSGGAVGSTYEATGRINIKNSALTNNTATSGGAISSWYSYLNLSNCTISGNKAKRAVGAINTAGRLALDSCTIVGNMAPKTAGISLGPRATLNNNIIAGNLLPTHRPGTDVDMDFPPNQLGTPALELSTTYNFIGAVKSQSADVRALLINRPRPNRLGVVYSGLKLGSLAFNGSSVPTHALLAGSPAINHGFTELPTDQRGVDRSDGVADVGAFEVESKMTRRTREAMTK